MVHLLRKLLHDDGGQDLIEYTLLVAFVALTTAGLFLGSGQNVTQTWSSANSVLTTAADQQTPVGGGNGSSGGRSCDLLFFSISISDTRMAGETAETGTLPDSAPQ